MSQHRSTDDDQHILDVAGLRVRLPRLLQSVSATTLLLVLTLGCRGDGTETTGLETPRATTLSVTPDSVRLAMGDTAEFDATPRDGEGNAVSGYIISWAITDTAVATVDGDGTATGRESGRTEVTATAEREGQSLSGWSQLVVDAAEDENGAGTASSSTFREHEPADMTKISENPSDVAEPSDWNLISSKYDIATDSGAPHSPENVGRWTYPQGSVDSGSLNLGTLTHANFNYDTVYLDIYIKLSSNFQYHSSSTNKMAWFTSLDVSGSNPMYLNANKDQTGEARWTINLQSPNVPNRTLGQNLNKVYITKGEWEHIELLLVSNSAGGTADGEAHLWINGTKRGEHTDVEWFSDASFQFDKFKINPVWGGQNDTVQETMYMYHDHIYLSGR